MAEKYEEIAVVVDQSSLGNGGKVILGEVAVCSTDDIL